jgi:hypothetical protein
MRLPPLDCTPGIYLANHNDESHPAVLLQPGASSGAAQHNNPGAKQETILLVSKKGFSLIQCLFQVGMIQTVHRWLQCVPAVHIQSEIIASEVS